MALNISKNHDSIVNAWKDVVDDKSSTNWAVFGYEGQTNTLQVVATGDGSLEDMTENLSAGKCMYAFCRVKDPKTTLQKNVLIIWQGEGAPDTRKGVCANHVRPIGDLLKGTHVTFTARTDDEVEPEFIMDKVIKASSSKFDFDSSHRPVSPPSAPVGSVYKKIDPSLILKERDEYLQNQQREDLAERHHVEVQRRKSQQEELQQISRNRQASMEDDSEKRASQTAINAGSNPVTAALESSSYVNLQKKNWEEAQKSATNVVKPQVEKKPVRPFAVATPPPKPPHQMHKPAAFGPKGTLSAPRVVLAPKKANDPDVKAREEEERRRWEQSQKEAENEEKERRLKAESMRQERLKEVQALVSARRQSEDLTDEYNNTKTRTVSQASENKSRSSSSVGAGSDVAMQAYREEERRKFEELQRESEKDEQERRHRGESLRQERLRELAALTQKDATSSKDSFSSLGQTVKENRAKGKRGEDPDLLARREEEKRRFEEAQREAQEEENERKNKAEMLRQQRAQEAAALVAHRTTSAKARFEQTSPKEEQAPSPMESRQRAGSAQQAARALFEHSSASHHQHPVSPPHSQPSHSKVPLTPQTSQSSVGQEQPEMSHTDTDYVHPSQRALPPLPHEEHGQQNGSGRYERQNSGNEDGRHDHHHTNGHNGTSQHDHEEHHAVNGRTQVRDTETKQEHAQVSPTHAVNAWKQGLPVRPPSDDEHEHDEDAWNEPEKVHHGVTSPTLSSSSSSGQSQGMQARALYDYQAADETEISFDPGDIITHVDKIDPGWYQGMAPSGAYGLFPANYVEMMT